MGSAYPLTGRSILVVEDEPLISLDMAVSLEGAGAQVSLARNNAEATGRVGQGGISAAVLDFGRGGERVAALCGLLRERGIPFMFYTGHADVAGNYPGTVVVGKPASGNTLVAAMVGVVNVRTVEIAAA